MRLEIRDNREESIVDGAEVVFFEKGYAKASISNICKTVNCSRTTLYSYFENKENLYLAVVNKSFKKFWKHFSHLKLDGKNGLEQIIAFADGYVIFSSQFPKNYMMILEFYGLLKRANNKKLQSKTDTILFNCTFFEEVKRNAEKPIAYLVKTIKEGQQDGSINNHFSAGVLFLNLWAYLIGSSQLFSFSDETQSSSLFDVEVVSAEENVFLFIKKLLV